MFGECFKLDQSRFQINVVYHRLSQRGRIPNLLGVVTSVISIKITKAKLKLYLFLFCQYLLILSLWNHISARHIYLPHLTCLSSLFAYFLCYFFSFLSFEREITQRKCVSNKKLNLKKKQLDIPQTISRQQMILQDVAVLCFIYLQKGMYVAGTIQCYAKLLWRYPKWITRLIKVS